MDTGTVVDAGTYEVLRDRLGAQAAELVRRAEELNSRRVAAFGSTELALTSTGSPRTRNPSDPADVIAVGDRLLFGYNTVGVAGDKTAVEDVFALYDRELNRLPDDSVPGLLDGPEFAGEFTSLYRYYRDTRLRRLRRTDGRLLAVFQTGERADDIRVLRWALAADGSAEFLDARGDRDHVPSPAHEFAWTVTTRADHVPGPHPCVSIGGELSVSTVGGALTVRPAPGSGPGQEQPYTEPVEEPLQSLADAEVEYARAGVLLLLRVRPYKEETRRHLVFNTATRTVVRLDGVGQACRILPDGQGIVFPGGYCLANGAHRTFDTDTTGLEFDREVRSPNGEDVLYSFHATYEGRTLLLPYNLIRQEIAAPLSCHGHALFDDGTLVTLRARPDGPARVHQMQLWRSPFMSDTYAAAAPPGDEPLARIGNADLVRGISDCLALARAVTETTPATGVYQALLSATVRTTDTHHWLGDPRAGDLRALLDAIRDTTGQVLAEFETVQTLAGQAAGALAETGARITSLVRRFRGETPHTAVDWVTRLTELRAAYGHVATLKEHRYADGEAIDELAATTAADITSFAHRAVEFMRREDAFNDYHEALAGFTTNTGTITTTAEAARVTGRVDELAAGLGEVIEVVAGLDIGDATVRTAVLERIAEVLGALNSTRATLDARRKELLSHEGRAEFAAELTLLGQTVTASLAAAGTPAECDDQLAALLLRLESLESRFAESDNFLAELTERRTDVYEAFSARKQRLQDARSRRAERLAESAARTLETVARRLAALESTDAVNTFLASDPMPATIRRTVAELRELGEQGRAEELEGRITSARQEAARALRDRADLYTEGGSLIRLGRHRFAVNTQPVDLALVPHGEGLAFALTGTDYRAPVTDAEFEATRPYWSLALPSESPGVYRGEYLAARLLETHGPAALQEADLPSLARQTAEEAYDEGYERGVHDHDAALILGGLLSLHAGAGLLRYPARARAAAQLFWAHRTTEETRTGWTRRAVSMARARETFGLAPAIADWCGELAEVIGGPHAVPAAEYLFEEITSGGAFVTSAAARTLLDKFRRAVGTSAYDEDLAALGGDLAARHQLVENWLSAFSASTGHAGDPGDRAEAVAVELCPGLARQESEARLTRTVEGLLGSHPRIERRRLTVQLDEFLARTRDFRERTAPGFRAYQRTRGALARTERARLRLDDHRPRVLTSFVRNRLIDEVYLPLVGDNLAKQIGAAGDTRGTDSHGLLLLVSPPGYGKTTLVEYIADRLGLILVTVKGPALGPDVTSLDPALAPNATARREVESINFALETGSNTLLYLDDIQHTSQELLQKFISLCDAQRRIDGVWNGESRTYDLRGKRFAVCMAGNPYTGSGQRFDIPDMLANRADVWNLGDVLSGKEEVFALSFVENALTAHPVLAPLAARDRADLELLVRLAAADPTARADRLGHPYAPAELDRVLAVLRHLLTARATVLAVNEAYIASAAQAPADRTEPPFLLQGSYRDMNRIAARIDPVMNAAELAAVIDDHYTGEAQTLATGAEANLLKLAELRSSLTPGQSARWTEIKAAHLRSRALGGPDTDPLTRAVGVLDRLADQVSAVETAITRAAGR